MLNQTKYCRHPNSYPCFYCTFASLGVKSRDLLDVVFGFFRHEVKSYSGHGCDRCGGVDEPYMLHDSTWNALVDNTGEKFLCLACCELRYGGKLALKYFVDAPINFGIMGLNCREYVKVRRPRKKTP